MPLHHPMRLAEEVATLDVLTGGRVEFGAGPRRVPAQLPRLRRRDGREPRDVRRRTSKSVKTGMDAASASMESKCVPKPLQRPHPPIRLAANSADTFTFAGANGYPIFAGGPVNPIPVLADRLKIYEPR